MASASSRMTSLQPELKSVRVPANILDAVAHDVSMPRSSDALS
jgi:hypothetical protein